MRQADLWMAKTLRDKVRHLGRIPTRSDFHYDWYNYESYLFRFGTMRNALITAGIDPDTLEFSPIIDKEEKMPKRWTNEEILASLRKLSAKIDGQRITSSMVAKNHDLPTLVTINKRYGSLQNALAAAGVLANYEPKCDLVEAIMALRWLTRELHFRLPRAGDVVNRAGGTYGIGLPSLP